MFFDNVTRLEAVELANSFMRFNFYACLFILVPGLGLNILTFTIYFARKKFWHRTTMGLYYSISSLISIGVVCIALFNYFPDSLGHDLTSKSTLWCQIIWLARNQLIYTSSCFSILVTLDKTLCIVFPNRFRFLTQTKNLILMFVLIFVFVAGLVTPNWWRYLKSFENHSNQTVTLCVTQYVPNAIYLVESILARILPSVINMTMNVIIIRRVFLSKRSMAVWNDRESHSNALTSRDVWFIYTLLAQNFAYFILCLPYIVVSFFYIIFALQLSGETTPQSQFAHIVQSFCVWGNFVYVSCKTTTWSLSNWLLFKESMPFFFSLAFNKIFRDELVTIIRKDTARVSNNVVSRRKD